MTRNASHIAADESAEAVERRHVDLGEALQEGHSRIDVTRRAFLEVLGAGLLVTVTAGPLLGQQQKGEGRKKGGGGKGGGGGRPIPVAARIHIGQDGVITVMTGKVELGQGARTELSMAAAEELRVPLSQIQLVMADTDLVPDDGSTNGSRTTPSSVPAVRRGAAAARNLLIGLACAKWKAASGAVEARDGAIANPATRQTVTYAELAKAEDVDNAFQQMVPADVELTPVKEWKVFGIPTPRPNRRDLVTGAHRYPSDIVRPNMLYGKVLRPPAYGATLASLDESEAKAMDRVVVVRDGDFAGCAAPTTWRAEQALKALAKGAAWNPAPAQPSNKELAGYLKKRARGGGGADAEESGSPKEAAAKGGKTFRAAYETAYIQHTAMETRSTVAEWDKGKLTVWMGSQGPFGARSQLAREFGIGEDQVRVIVPDSGGGFGGKNSNDSCVEAARLAKAAGKPVLVKYTREEEFTWAYFRPAVVIEIQAALDASGKIAAWDFNNIGDTFSSALQSPYAIAGAKARMTRCEGLLRTSAYRCLSATVNNFARESFMDELAAAAGADPLAFRLAHLQDERLRAVLEKAAKEFHWDERAKKRDPKVGVGLACGTDKGGFVAACVEVEIDRKEGRIVPRLVCEAFECGAILNPDNLKSQIMGCIMMGMGGALREEMVFENGKILNATFSKYLVPRFKDLPELDIYMLDRPDLPSAGAGECPIIALAPAIGNAVFQATGVRLRALPMRGEALKEV